MANRPQTTSGIGGAEQAGTDAARTGFGHYGHSASSDSRDGGWIRGRAGRTRTMQR